MFRWVVGQSLKFRYLVLALAVGLMYFGVGRIRQMPVDVFPEFAPPMVEIQTICLGLVAEEVESLVTAPMELVLTGVPGLDIIRSKSVPRFVVNQDVLRAWHRPAAGSTAGSRARVRGDSDAPDLGRPAGDVATAVRDQPDDEDRDIVEEAIGDRLVDDHLLDHQAAAASRAGRGQCGHLG